MELQQNWKRIKTKKLGKDNFSFVFFKDFNSKSGSVTVDAYYNNLLFILTQPKDVQSNLLYLKKSRQTILMQNYQPLLLRTTKT